MMDHFPGHKEDFCLPLTIPLVVLVLVEWVGLIQTEDRVAKADQDLNKAKAANVRWEAGCAPLLEHPNGYTYEMSGVGLMRIWLDRESGRLQIEHMSFKEARRHGFRDDGNPNSKFKWPSEQDSK